MLSNNQVLTSLTSRQLTSLKPCMLHSFFTIHTLTSNVPNLCAVRKAPTLKKMESGQIFS